MPSAAQKLVIVNNDDEPAETVTEVSVQEVLEEEVVEVTVETAEPEGGVGEHVQRSAACLGGSGGAIRRPPLT